MKPKEEAMNHSDGDPDDLSDDTSSHDSNDFDDTDLLSSSVHDDVTAQLAAAGQIHCHNHKCQIVMFVFRSDWSSSSSSHRDSKETQTASFI